MFKLGKVINFRGIVTYAVDNIGNFSYHGSWKVMNTMPKEPKLCLYIV